MRLGEHGSYALAGGTMVVSGGVMMASRYAGEGRQGKLYSMGRAGGIVAITALGIGEGFRRFQAPSANNAA